MRYICAITFSFIVPISAYAKFIDLYVKNDSEKTIIIEKMDGDRITLYPKSRISGIFFENHSTVNNYVDGKKICSWYINAHPDSDIEMDGIGYANPYGDRWECVSYFLQNLGAAK
ncbi:hypothetical protein ACQUW5_15035 [Legionella sp. CNM-1927-20]|uniref:hypothetical protein n=1 Tax=Legionella sp. CNM-1927-20 TaxID=3422221 RepID=UPI00403B13C8